MRDLMFNLLFPKTSEAFAYDILKEVLEDLKTRPCPLVFASFSGGPKASMYKVLQIIKGKVESLLNLDDCRMLRDCISVFIYDSCLVDFVSDVLRRFATNPAVLNMSRPPKVLSWIVDGFYNDLDSSLFLNNLESQRADYLQTLYSSASMGAPYLILCSESDAIARYQVISNFAQRVCDLGGDVKFVTMNGSPHVGHYKMYPNEYKAAVAELLGKATAVYSQRIRRLEGEETCNGISEPIYGLKNGTTNPNESYRVATTIPSVGFYKAREVVPLNDEQKARSIHAPFDPTKSTQRPRL